MADVRHETADGRYDNNKLSSVAKKINLDYETSLS
jgi:hypothetical protein